MVYYIFPFWIYKNYKLIGINKLALRQKKLWTQTTYQQKHIKVS